MRKINTGSSNADCFKNSILISLHYYDVSYHPGIWNNISLTVFDENNNIIYMPNNNSTNKAQTVKINNYRYAAIKLPKNKFIKLNELLKSFSHLELREHIIQNIPKNKIKGIGFET